MTTKKRTTRTARQAREAVRISQEASRAKMLEKGFVLVQVKIMESQRDGLKELADKQDTTISKLVSAAITKIYKI